MNQTWRKIESSVICHRFGLMKMNCVSKSKHWAQIITCSIPSLSTFYLCGLLWWVFGCISARLKADYSLYFCLAEVDCTEQLNSFFFYSTLFFKYKHPKNATQAVQQDQRVLLICSLSASHSHFTGRSTQFSRRVSWAEFCRASRKNVLLVLWLWLRSTEQDRGAFFFQAYGTAQYAMP